jgi:hypothetical protein
MQQKKKIAILTYHNAVNYGAVLQAYALSTKLSSLGVACEILDYRCPAVVDQYRIKRLKHCSSVRNFFAHNLTCMLHAGKKTQFERFQRRLPLTLPCAKERLAACSNDYAAVMTGSDQVFNPICNGGDPAYLLDFAGDACIKSSYAASMGSIRQFERYKIETLSLLRRFQYLSLREQDAAEYLSHRLGRPCRTSLDPVFLLDGDHWSALAAETTVSPYIFVYNLMDLGHMRDFVKKIRKKTGFLVIAANRTVMGDASYLPIARLRSNASPEEFLGYIKGAEYVITDSFHGTSLAILMEKRFFTAVNRAENNTNARLFSLLEKTALTDRVISEHTLDMLNTPIDFPATKKSLEPEYEASVQYLQAVCSAAEQDVAAL